MEAVVSWFDIIIRVRQGLNFGLTVESMEATSNDTFHTTHGPTSAERIRGRLATNLNCSKAGFLTFEIVQ